MAVLRLPTGEVSIDAAGFDVDGVLRDTGYLAFNNCRLAIAELGGTPPELEDFVHDWGGLLNTYYRSCGVVASDEEIERVNARYTETHDLVDPFHDVEDTLEHLEKLGIRTFALSGHHHDVLETWFIKHGLHTKFDHVQGGGGGKVRHLIELRQKLSMPPARACYVGDWAQDMRAARQAGLIPVGISRSLKTHEVLERNGAAVVVDHLCDFVALIH